LHVGIVGAGIVGLTLARQLTLAEPACQVTIFEKEDALGKHQTSHNSGVVHAGLYYAPGSLKATLCSRGRGMLQEYCVEHQVPFRESGKLVVAVDEGEIAGLREIQRRSLANRVPDLRWMEAGEMAEIEPHVRGVAALHSPHTGVADFAALATAVADEVLRSGGELKTSSAVTGISRRNGRIQIVAKEQEYSFDRVVVCAGLQSDRVSRLANGPKDPAIVPFLGMYYRLVADRRDLVKSLIYPVPDPRYPFLGVHLTRTVRDEVLVGPNALLALAREGYRPTRVSLRDTAEMLRFPGFYRLLLQNWKSGLREMIGASSKKLFIAAAQRYVPELTTDDVERGTAGVRAQAVWADGSLADDFALADEGGVLSVRNAPSPAATSSFAIAEHLASIVLQKK
jgi:L-2-hydroxyglutarate oxidase LhgO